MQPYVIRQGDYLLSLARQFGFDADTVWNDPANADLRKLRPDPNILWPTDVLQIPDPNAPPATKSLVAGTTNAFVSDVPTVSITVTFTDASLASQAFAIQELPDLTPPPTDASGKLTFSAPVTLQTATIVFTDAGQTFKLNIGHLDPIGTLSGVFQRLQNLGYIDADVRSDSINVDCVRMALRAFNAAAPSDPPASSPDSSTDGPPSSQGSGDRPSASPPSSSASPPSSPPPSSNASPPSSPPPSSNGAPTSDPAPPDSAPPPSSESAPPSSDLEQPDNAGLNDDGTLDAATSAKLVAAHGS